MARVLSVLIVLLVLVFIGGQAYSQDLKAKTETGRQVELKSDGTWKFLDSKPTTAAAGAYQKSENAKNVYTAKGGKVSLYFDSTKWIQEKSDDPEKISFEYREGDLYGLMISERLALPISTLRDIAIKNAQSAAPDVKVVHEENRKVNGVNLLCMQMNGTINGIKFTYYGYYYAGKSGSIQLLTYTSQNLFQESLPAMTEFLNGLVVKE